MSVRKNAKNISINSKLVVRVFSTYSACEFMYTKQLPYTEFLCQETAKATHIIPFSYVLRCRPGENSVVFSKVKLSSI